MNVVVLIGRLARDPELRYTQSGKAVCNATVAVDRFGGDGVDFIDLVTWDKTAENLAKYMSKGRQIGVSGRLQVRTYEDKGGSKRWKTEVVANNVEFLGSKGDTKERSADPAGAPGELGQEVIMSDEDLPF